MGISLLSVIYVFSVFLLHLKARTTTTVVSTNILCNFFYFFPIIAKSLFVLDLLVLCSLFVQTGFIFRLLVPAGASSIYIFKIYCV